MNCSADGETLNAKRDPDPEHNDLWDMRLKFKLRSGEELHLLLFVPTKQNGRLGKLFLKMNAYYDILEPVLLILRK